MKIIVIGAIALAVALPFIILYVSLCSRINEIRRELEHLQEDES